MATSRLLGMDGLRVTIEGPDGTTWAGSAIATTVGLYQPMQEIRRYGSEWVEHIPTGPAEWTIELVGIGPLFVGDQGLQPGPGRGEACPFCSCRVLGSPDNCPNCGGPLAQDLTPCPSCQARIRIEAHAACPHCGRPLGCVTS